MIGGGIDSVKALAVLQALIDHKGLTEWFDESFSGGECEVTAIRFVQWLSYRGLNNGVTQLMVLPPGDFCDRIMRMLLFAMTRDIAIKWYLKSREIGISFEHGEILERHFRNMEACDALLVLGRSHKPAIADAVQFAMWVIDESEAAAKALLAKYPGQGLPGCPAFEIVVRWLVEGDEIDRAREVAAKAKREGWNPIETAFVHAEPWDELVDRELKRRKRRRKRWRYPV